MQAYDETLAWRERVTVVLERATLEFDLLSTEHEIVLGLRERGVQYRFTRAGGERLLALARESRLSRYRGSASPVALRRCPPMRSCAPAWCLTQSASGHTFAVSSSFDWRPT